eukprot:g413.t1
MCSFLLVSWVLRNLAVINTYLKSRGPDATSLYRNERFELLFNHLHMTGAERLQPLFLSSAEQGTEQHAHVEKKEQEGELFATFNGEIYNWAELRDEHADAFRSESFKIRSDGDVILPLYKKYGPAFLKLLDGEFAIVVVDQQRGRIVVSTDVFGTKPLYVATYPAPDRGPAVGQENQANAVPVSAPEAAATTHFGVSVYRRAGSPAPDDAQKPRKSLGLPNLRLLDSFPLFEFDLRQYKTTTGDAVAAFEKAIRKRVRTSLHPPFLGLSSGYDAGAVHLALTKEKIPHYYYTIMGKEDMQIVERRNEFADANSYGTIIDYSYNMFQQVRTYLMACAEPYEFTPFSRKHVGRTTVVDDDASMGLAQIMGVARQMGTLVYLTGSGADEVLSDYGFNGTRIFPQSTTGGRFPDNLAEVFPWRIFFLGTMRDYIMKEELVGGAFGIEARYPFLDKEFVQETLWLAAELKNSEYKKVLHDFFEQNAYPFKHRDKTGFSSAENRILSPQSLVYEMTDYFAHGIEKAKIVDPINVELVVSTAREGGRAGGANRKTQQAPAEEDEERPRRIGGASSDLSVLQNHKHAFQKRQKERMLSQQIGYTRRYWGLDTLSEGDFGRDLFVSFYTPLLQIEKDTSDVCWKDFNGYAIHIMNDDYLRERERIEREEDDKEFFDVRGSGARKMVGGGGGEGARGPRADTYSSMNYTVLSEVGTESAANAVFNGESEVAEKMLESEMNKEGGGGPVTLPQGGGAHHQQLYVDPVVHRDPGDNFFRSVGYWAARLLDDFAFLRSLLQPHLGALMQEQETALHVKRELNEGLKILVVDAEPDVERKGFAVTERLVDSLPHSMQLHTIQFEIESPVMFHRHGCGTRRNLVNSFLNLGLGEKIVVPAGLPTDPHPEILEACPLFQWPQGGAEDHSGSTGGKGNQRKTLEARFNAIDFPSAGAVGPGSKSNEDSSADASSSSPMCGHYFRREKFAAYQDGRQDIRMPHFSTHYNMPQEGFIFGRVSLLKKLLLFIKTWKRFAAENCQATHRVPIRESDLGAAGARADHLYSEDPDAQKEHRRKDVTVRGMVRRRRGFQLESSGEDTGASSPILAVRHAALDYRCKTSFLLHLYFLLNPEEIELDYEGALIMTIDGFTNHIWHQDYGLLYITWDHLLCFSTGSEAFRSSRELLYDYWDQYGAVELPTEKRREYFQRLQAYDEVGRVRWQQALDFDNQLRRMFGINQEVGGEEEVHRGKGGFNLASDLALGEEILTQIRARI